MKKVVIFLFIFIFLISVVSAVPPLTQVGASESLDLFYPSVNTLPENEDFTIHIHLTNGSEMLDNNSAGCYGHFYNTSGKHSAQNVLDFDGNLKEWELNIDKGNFTRGVHSWFLQCNTSNQIGSARGNILVTPLGNPLEESEAKFYFAIIFSILVLFAIFLIIFILTPYENEKQIEKGKVFVTRIVKSKYLKLISLWIAYGFFLWFMAIISGMANNYIFFDGTRNMIARLYAWLSLLGWGLNIFMSFFLFILAWKDIILNKEILKNGKALLKEL